MQRLAPELVLDDGKEDLGLLLRVPNAAGQKRESVGVDGLDGVDVLVPADFLEVRVFGPGPPWALLGC